MSESIKLPFEAPIAEIETKMIELKQFSEEQNIDVTGEIDNMEKKIMDMREQIYKNLTAWQKVQVARHPDRPYTMDYIKTMTTNFIEIHGDRIHRDDRAIIGGFATLGKERVMILGSQKGRDTKSNVECNFGCAHPEGYRKAMRMMKLADKFNLPIITLIDTKGAYAGLASEERHIAEAIAVNLRESFNLKVPIICVIVGEGGSGGALGIGIGNRILILEHAYYSVISPEGCAAILWKDRAYSDQAAESLKITGKDLIELGLADQIIPEPPGGAHTDLIAAANLLKQALLENLAELNQKSATEIQEERYQKFRAMGQFEGNVD
ncbi:MAG: acetyl-CoA carboxylase carboxyltransferase subunit alpha [Pontiellaceae bacterium]